MKILPTVNISKYFFYYSLSVCVRSCVCVCVCVCVCACVCVCLSLSVCARVFVCVCAGEACWWTIHPASKQRSEGEKVRVGDDLILVSVSSERYLVSFPESEPDGCSSETRWWISLFQHLSYGNGSVHVDAAFQQTLWSVAPICSGSEVAQGEWVFMSRYSPLPVRVLSTVCFRLPDWWRCSAAAARSHGRVFDRPVGRTRRGTAQVRIHLSSDPVAFTDIKD